MYLSTPRRGCPEGRHAIFSVVFVYLLYIHTYTYLLSLVLSWSEGFARLIDDIRIFIDVIWLSDFFCFLRAEILFLSF